MPAERVTSRSPWHVLLVIDDSGSMADAGARTVNEAMEFMIEEMRVQSQGMKPYFKISVIQFGSDARTLAEAQNEQAIDIDHVTRFKGESGTTNVAAGLREALLILERNGGAETDFDPFVFFFSDGKPDNEATALKVADELKALAIPAGRPRLVSIGVGDVGDAFMQNLSSRPELYKKYDGWNGLKTLLPAIGTIASARTGADGVETAIMQI